MPSGDRTGPMGAGAKSGRAAGFCAGFERPGYANTAMTGSLHRGMGRRRSGWCDPLAGGRCWRHRFSTTGRPRRMSSGGYPTAAQPGNSEFEKEFLRNRSQTLQSELDAVNKWLGEMEQLEITP